MEIKEKRSLDKVFIIVLLTVILLLVLGIGLLLVSDQQLPDLTTIFKSNGEYTIPLDEFVVNLKSDSSRHNYAKLSIALMYIDEEHGSEVSKNINKIRDLVITNLRDKTADDLLDEESIVNLKSSIKGDINTCLDLSIIEDIYITDIIIQ